jgi:hypothetical protein
MSKDGFIGLHTEQENRAPLDFRADAVVTAAERDGEWGAFCGGEYTDGAGVLHLLEGRFAVRNNNVTLVAHHWAGQVETIELAGLKLDDFALDEVTGRLRLRGHEFGPTAVFRAMGSCRATVQLNGFTPRGEGGGSLPHLPAYDRRKQTFVDVAPDSPFHEPIEQLAAMELISGYDLPNGKREFRQGVSSITRAQAAKVVYGALRWLLGARRK